MVSLRYKIEYERNPSLNKETLKRFKQINADYDVVAEAEAILAEAALVSA